MSNYRYRQKIYEEKRTELERRRKAIWNIKRVEQKGEYGKTSTFVKDFIKKYPENEEGKYYYCKLLRRSGLYEEALEVLENLSAENIMYKLDIIKCNLELGNYLQVIDLCEECLPKIESVYCRMFLSRAKMYAMNKLGILAKGVSDLGYIENQLNTYDENRTIDYIEARKVLNGEIEVKDLMHKLQKILPESKFLKNYLSMTDTYLFLYPKAGMVDGKISNILKVVTVNNTHNIVTIYPIKNLDKYPSSVLNDNLFLELEQTQENRPSQIEKFNKKYRKTLETVKK